MNKPLRFLWRFSRNILCFFPAGRRMLFPKDRLSMRFGRGDAEYAWSVFSHHLTQIDEAGFTSAQKILEIGPGRNIGTSLLFSCYLRSIGIQNVQVVCWDVFNNIKPDVKGFWVEIAKDLLLNFPETIGVKHLDVSSFRESLLKVSEGSTLPYINYRVESLAELEEAMSSNAVVFDLIYSQAAIEHIWFIDKFWNAMERLTSDNGWHSHRIDLADHGSRESNYIEMLEWSKLSYWLTMRFIPGATNRWRATHYLKKLKSFGMKIVYQQMHQRDQLPIPLYKVSSEFSSLGEAELRTIALDVVAIKSQK